MDIINPKNLRLILKALSGLNKERGNLAEQKPINPVPVKTFKALPVKYNFNVEMKAQTINRQDQAVFIKELLNLPKDLKELVALLTTKNPSRQTMLNLLELKNPKINPEILQQLLETNSKEVINKLIKLFQQSPGNMQNYDQLKDIMGLMNQIIPSRKSSPQEIITQLLLLYLPWLPLSEQQKIEIHFEKKKSGSSEEDEEVAMVVYVSTINLGRFKITIIIDKNGHLDIHIEHMREDQEHESEESYKNKKEVIENILKTLNSEMKEEKLEAKIVLSEIKQKNYEENPKQEITIAQINSISPSVLIASQKTAQIILEADEKISLLDKRKSNIN
ncbi:MAG TPA: hypothetical protein P5556_05245 [Candidatus Gastranaerophilales bacterium]|nr:hypothetical protein [Candidatus Gastranaerophilales bacterium]